MKKFTNIASLISASYEYASIFGRTHLIPVILAILIMPEISLANEVENYPNMTGMVLAGVDLTVRF
jgi:hypothetical protein